ncbi:MAG TPA: AAA family ATPase [Candidatus Limnocylindrales bacterium]|nr:AAA family ATPase [Candidatus Limnocylindrales bacterium]
MSADKSRPDEIDQLLADALYQGPSVTADQLVGVDACLRQLAGQLTLLERPELGVRLGIQPSGSLFLGPPGTGKTLLARFLAGQLGVPMYQLSADQFGDDPAQLHRIFGRLSRQRAVLFIDEISILCQRRDWSSAEERRMLAALLTELDGLSSLAAGERLWVIGACTPDIHLDPAIHRSGRLGVTVEFALPSVEHRAQLLRLYLAAVPNALSEEDIARLAEMSGGVSGADVRDYINQAASLVLAEAVDVADPVIEYRHLEIVFGRRGFVAAEGRPGREPDWETAVHEAGHAVIAYVLFGRPALAQVTIGFGPVGRRRMPTRGHFSVSDDWAEKNHPTSLSWSDHVAVKLAGVCAEELILGYRGSGASSDIAAATSLILDQFDQGDPSFGPSRTEMEGGPGARIGGAGSEAMRATAWHLVRSRFGECWSRTGSLVSEHRYAIERLASALLESKSRLTGDEIVEVLDTGVVATGASGAAA